jgi:SET domain-containing protein
MSVLKEIDLSVINSEVKFSNTTMTKRKISYAIKRTAAGLGFFTLDPIPKDKKIIEYIGLILTKEEADKKGGKYLMRLDEEYVIDGSPRSNAARYINHSCEPNAKAFRSGVRVWIWSIKAIKAGEEITFDYGKKYFNEQIKPKGCKCISCAKNTE